MNSAGSKQFGAEQEILRGAFGLFMGFADNKNEMLDILYEELF